VSDARRYGRITPQRRRALEILVSAHPGHVARGASTSVDELRGDIEIAWHHARWMLDRQLVELHYDGLGLTAAGIQLARELGLELLDGRHPAICQEWDCERPPVPGGRFCRAHGGRR
jgi:hypothetical protein